MLILITIFLLILTILLLIFYITWLKCNINLLVGQLADERKPKILIFKRGESKMDKDKGYKMIFTCGRPALTALDIATWDVIFQIGGKTVKSVSFPVDQEAMEFKILKGVKEIQLAIAFTDRDGNQSDYTWSDVFDSQDNIAPAMPGAVSFTMREESENDGDIFEIAEAVEPDDPVDDEESDDYEDQEEPIEGEIDNKEAYDNDDDPIEGEIVDDGGEDAVDGDEKEEIAVP